MLEATYLTAATDCGANARNHHNGAAIYNERRSSLRPMSSAFLISLGRMWVVRGSVRKCGNIVNNALRSVFST
jgi:hypothetical protein